MSAILPWSLLNCFCRHRFPGGRPAGNRTKLEGETYCWYCNRTWRIMSVRLQWTSDAGLARRSWQLRLQKCNCAKWNDIRKDPGNFVRINITITWSVCVLMAIGDSTCGKVCNSTQTNDWNCFSSPVVPQISLKRWNNWLLCVRRGSLTSVDRPAVKDNSCPDGYKLCSSSGFSSIFRGLQDTTSSVCQKTNEPCPVTGFSINSNNITLTRGGEAASVGLPIVDLELTRGRPCKFPSGSSEA